MTTPNGDFCGAGSGAHECEIDEPETETQACPDGSVVSINDVCPTVYHIVILMRAE